MKERMDNHPEINWSEVARQSIDQKLRELEVLERFKADSELTPEEAIELGRQLNQDVTEHYTE